jgi:hypothetical protein
MKKNTTKSILFLLPILFSLGVSANGTGLENETVNVDDFAFNPSSRYVSEEKWKAIINDSLDKREKQNKQERMFGKAKVITVDTRDKKSCREIEEQISQYSNSSDEEFDLCGIDPSKPYSTITVYENPYESKGVSYGSLDSKSKKIVDATRNLSILGLGVIGAIWLMPEEVSNWTEEKVGTKFGEKYVDHLKEGPIMDKDAPVVNFIGHPYSGAIYYTVARHAGLSKMQSFGYSFFMSTAFWEYGVEAIFEEPSIQDLIITPVLGSLLGAFFESYTEEIKRNNGKVLGNKTVGNVLMTVMNPVEGIMEGMNDMFKTEFIKDGRIYLYSRPKYHPEEMEYEVPGAFTGVGVEFKF